MFEMKCRCCSLIYPDPALVYMAVHYPSIPFLFFHPPPTARLFYRILCMQHIAHIHSFFLFSSLSPSCIYWEFFVLLVKRRRMLTAHYTALTYIAIFASEKMHPLHSTSLTLGVGGRVGDGFFGEPACLLLHMNSWINKFKCTHQEREKEWIDVESRDPMSRFSMLKKQEQQ